MSSTDIDERKQKNEEHYGNNVKIEDEAERCVIQFLSSFEL
jgi:hypothetical protein